MRVADASTVYATTQLYLVLVLCVVDGATGFLQLPSFAKTRVTVVQSPMHGKLCSLMQ